MTRHGKQTLWKGGRFVPSQTRRGQLVAIATARMAVAESIEGSDVITWRCGLVFILGLIESRTMSQMFTESLCVHTITGLTLLAH